MFSTSADILNLVLAACIVLLTIFLCVSLYYLISSVRKTHRIIKMIESTLNKAEDVVSLAKDKIKNSGTYFMLFGELAKKLMDYFLDKNKKEEGSRNKTKTKKK